MFFTREPQSRVVSSLKLDHNNIIYGGAEREWGFTEIKRQCEIITATESFREPSGGQAPLTGLLGKGVLLSLDISVCRTESGSLRRYLN